MTSWTAGGTEAVKGAEGEAEEGGMSDTRVLSYGGEASETGRYEHRLGQQDRGAEGHPPSLSHLGAGSQLPAGQVVE